MSLSIAPWYTFIRTQPVATAGAFVDPTPGAVVSRATVRIVLAGTNTNATLFADNVGTPLANPFTTDTRGYAQAWMPFGVYQAIISGGDLPDVIPSPYTIGPFSIGFGTAAPLIFVTDPPYNADPTGVVSASSAFTAAIAAAAALGNGGMVIAPAGTYKLSSNISTPKNVALWLMTGAVLNIDSGHSVTINGPLTADLTKHVEGLGTVAATLGDAWAEWWGATYDGVTDDSAAWTKALATLIAGGKLHVSPHSTYVGTTQFSSSLASLEILGYRESSQFITDLNTSLTFLFTTTGEQFYWHDFKILLNQANGCGLDLVECRTGQINRVTIFGVVNPNANYGIRIRKNTVFAFGVHIDDCYFNSIGNAVAFTDTVTDSQVTNCAIIGAQSPLITGSLGVAVAQTCDGITISENTIQGWTDGVLSTGTNLHVANNSFEGNTTHLNVQKGAANARIWAFIAGNVYSGAGVNAVDNAPGRQVYWLDISNDASFPNNMGIGGTLIIGGTGTVSDPTSVSLEIGSSLAVLITRVTTTQKNALTPQNGMLVYDVTLHKFQGYENGSWQNLI